jgi:N-acetylglucosamine-6-phosphate deacetylase
MQPSYELIEAWGGHDGIRIVTLAPELPGAIDIIETLVAAGVTVSLGHSDCTLDEAERAIEAGARAGTHLFNAMSGLDHRRPGLAAALLANEGMVAGLIVDGVHVHPAMVTLAARMLGPERLVLITDAIAAMGAGDGLYHLGDVEVRVEGARVVSGEDTLAGSVLSMDAAVRNLVHQAGWALEAAIRSATTTPADLLGEVDRGRIVSGARGDLVALTEGGEVLVTVVAGEILEDAR